MVRKYQHAANQIRLLIIMSIPFATAPNVPSLSRPVAKIAMRRAEKCNLYFAPWLSNADALLAHLICTLILHHAISIKRIIHLLACASSCLHKAICRRIAVLHPGQRYGVIHPLTALLA